MREPEVRAGKVAAWAVKCDADNVYDLDHPTSGFWNSRSKQPVNTTGAWRLHTNYRAGLVQPGDRCFFWVSTDVTGTWISGLWGECDVLAPATANVGGGPWIDHQKMSEMVPYLPLRWRFLPRPVPKTVIRRHPALQGCELVNAPEMSNPVALSAAEVAVLDQLISSNPGPVVSSTGRGGLPVAPKPW